MRAVRTRAHREPAFAYEIWVTNNGSALAVEADPTNLASVAASRILKVRPKRGCVIIHGGYTTMRMVAYDGTGGQTLVLQCWFYDETLGIWVKNSTQTTLTIGAANTGSTIAAGNSMGSKHHAQVVSNAAGATALGIDLF